jgi:hypothetical protein
VSLESDAGISLFKGAFPMHEELKKCEHPACHCVVEDGAKYCSQYCKDAAGTIELSCNCRHAGCAMNEQQNAA